MPIKLLRAFSLLIPVVGLWACSGSSEDGIVNIQTHRKMRENKMLRANRYLNIKDMLVIKGYMERHDLKMKFADLGYYYASFGKNNGAPIKKGSVVLYEYNVSLIDGTPLDSSGKNLAQITIDKSEGISGLHDGLRKVAEGDSAIFIFPPHLAYGLVGDGEKIPARSTLVYKIKVKSVR